MVSICALLVLSPLIMGGGAGSGMTTGDAEASSSDVASSKGLSAAGFSAVSIPNAVVIPVTSSPAAYTGKAKRMLSNNSI